VLVSISLFQGFYCFLRPLDARIKLAAAISDGLYFKRLASSREISCKYCAKKNTYSSPAKEEESFLNLSRNL
jgi:hypothetical protein